MIHERQNTVHRLLLVMMMTTLLMGCATTQERAQQRENTARQVAQAISERKLKVEVHSMMTQRYGAHRVTPDFYLLLRGDTLDSYLPFFGRAYGAVPYSTPSQGLNFTSPIEKMRTTELKHDGVRMEMEVSSQEDRYRYQLDIYPNGSAYIYVRAQERDAVSFDGELVF